MSEVRPRWWGWGIAALVGLAVLIRGWAEWKMGPVPIGYDSSTAYLTAFRTTSFNAEALRHYNLLYLIYVGLREMGASVFPAIKVVGTALFAAMVLLMVLVGRRGLRLSPQAALLAGLLLVLSLGGLRFAWDLHRNMLGIDCALFTLYSLAGATAPTKPLGRVGWGLLALLGFGATYTAHQLAFALLLITLVLLFGTAAMRLLKVPLLGQIVIWLIALVGTLVGAGEIHLGSISLVRALTPAEQAMQGGLSLHLGWLVFGPLLTGLGMIGVLRLKNLPLILLMGMLAVGALSPVFWPAQSLLYWDRWMYFLIFPLVYGAAALLAYWYSRGYWKVSLFLVLLLCLPAQRLLSSRTTLYSRLDAGKVFDLFPASFQTNAVAANPTEVEQLHQLPACLTELLMLSPSGPLVTTPNYVEVLDGFQPGIMSRLVFDGSPVPSGTYGFARQLSADARFRSALSDNHCKLFVAK